MTTPSKEHAQDYRQRDAASFLMLGTFFAVMGSLVLVGTFWTLERMHAMVVNIIAGLLLLAIGLGMLALGVRARRRLIVIDNVQSTAALLDKPAVAPSDRPGTSP